MDSRDKKNIVRQWPDATFGVDSTHFAQLIMATAIDNDGNETSTSANIMSTQGIVSLFAFHTIM